MGSRSRRYDVAVLLESASRYQELLDRAGVSGIRGLAANPFDPALHNIAICRGDPYRRRADFRLFRIGSVRSLLWNAVDETLQTQWLYGRD